jgi:hypothetical protein
MKDIRALIIKKNQSSSRIKFEKDTYDILIKKNLIYLLKKNLILNKNLSYDLNLFINAVIQLFL